MRAELGTLHDILDIIQSGRMAPGEWPKAKAILDYLDGSISAVQSKADRQEKLAAIGDAPVIPSLAAPVPEQGQGAH